MAAVDRNVLRVAIYELLHETDTPPPVVIDEAIEIAKRFGGEESGHFVNGVLDAVLKKALQNHDPPRFAPPVHPPYPSPVPSPDVSTHHPQGPFPQSLIVKSPPRSAAAKPSAASRRAAAVAGSHPPLCTDVAGHRPPPILAL
jgi:hypothetical protein